ncbi:MAG: collagen-like protein [Robiginitalea sp.]|uniref:collagen-like protein n=1 Tax=Robiginitalea sp. TaxID=1902411 RepID=UPI003C763D3E
MKNLGRFFTVIIAFISLSSCEGPAGPPGPPGFDGFDGQDGVNILGTVYDIVGDFTPSNDYSLFSVFAEDVPGLEVFETDVVLVYILWDQIDDPTGPIDIWRLLPQTLLLQQGILQYNYDFTFEDVSIFLESDFNLGFLGPGDTNNQVFRIAILPADGAGKRNLDTSNIQEVMEYLQVTEANIPRVDKN